MIDVRLENCVPKNPLSVQLEYAIQGFKWSKSKHGHLIESLSNAFTDYMPAGSVEVEDGSRCGFCGKEGITTEYWFTRSELSPEFIEETYGSERYRFFMPYMLVTGSKCKDFPFVGNYVRGLNGIFKGVRFDGTDRNALIRISNARLHEKAPLKSLMYQHLYLPINYVSWLERDALFNSLLYKYHHFVFAKRKKFPSNIPYIGVHRYIKQALGSKWYPSDAWSYDYYEDIVLGIPFKDIINNNGIL